MAPRKMKSAEFPYTGYLVSEPIFAKKEQRYYVGLWPIKGSGLRPTSRSLARYKLSVHLGRILEKWEQVDHIDGNKTNDSLDNLQILTIAENNRKARREQGTVGIPIELICSHCHKLFRRPKNQYNHKANCGQTRFFCSRECQHKGLIKKFPSLS